MLAFGASPKVSATTAVAVNQDQAMQQPSPADRAKVMTERLDKAVTLTDDQKPKVQAIWEKAYTDMAAEGADRRAISTKATDDTKALLTPEQVAKYPAGRGRRGGGGGGGK
jgi:hypothetical protein